MRSITFLLALLLAVACAAQQRTVHLLRADVPADLAGQKVFHAVLADLDPGVRCSFHGADVKVMIDNTLGAHLLLQRLAQGGAGEYHLVRDGGKTSRTGGVVHALELPAEGDTMDPDAVLQYQQAKDAWIQQHPDQYQQLNVLDPVPAQRNP